MCGESYYILTFCGTGIIHWGISEGEVSGDVSRVCVCGSPRRRNIVAALSKAKDGVVIFVLTKHRILSYLNFFVHSAVASMMITVLSDGLSGKFVN